MLGMQDELFGGVLEPEPLQDLVNHFVAEGKPERVERCVLHLNVATLDLNRVFRLCRDNSLHSALIYVNNRALNDYVAPACELLAAYARAAAAAASQPAAEDGAAELTAPSHKPGSAMAIGYKLLVYLRCCAGGEAFPPGTGRVPPAQAPDMRSQVVGWLLFSAPDNFTRLGWQGDAMSLGALLPAPYAPLRQLAALDAEATLSILYDTLDGWDTAEDELKEALRLEAVPGGAEAEAMYGSGDPGRLHAGGDPHCLAGGGQRCVVALLADGVFGFPEAAARPAARRCTLWRTLWRGPRDGAAAVLLEVLRMLAAPRPRKLGLKGGVPQSCGRCLGPAHVAASHSSCGGTARTPDAEDNFMAILDAMAGSAGWLAPAHAGVDPQEVLALAQRLLFSRAVARTLHLSRRFDDAVRWHMERSEADGYAGAFRYIDATLAPSSRLSSSHTAAFRSAVMSVLPQLTKAAPDQVAQLVMTHFANDQTSVIESLNGVPELQWRYLHGAMQAAAGEPRGRLRCRGGRQGELLDHKTCELYIRLMCRFSPRGVPFLMEHEDYRPEECLRACQA
eukprot:jgi/Tetstr1/459669/TSEL_005024.t1